jgi:hypothetical protein
MDETNYLKNSLRSIATSEIWIELAKRLNVRFGKIQMAIHEGRPSKYANVDIRVTTDSSEEENREA